MLILITIKNIKLLLKNLHKYRLFIGGKERLNSNKIISKLYLSKIDKQINQLLRKSLNIYLKDITKK